MGGSGIIGWATGVLESLGYLGVAALIALENIFPPIPSEVILPLTGVLAGQGRFTYWGALAAATAGSLAGAYVLYAIGYALGKERTHRLVATYGKWVFITEKDLDKSSNWFDHHGGKVVLVGRCIPGIRSLISIPAGIETMPLGKFSLYTVIGSGVWNAVLLGLGWWLGQRWQQVSQYVQYMEYAVWAAIIVTVVWFILHRTRSWRSSHRQQKPTGGKGRVGETRDER